MEHRNEKPEFMMEPGTSQDVIRFDVRALLVNVRVLLKELVPVKEKRDEFWTRLQEMERMRYNLALFIREEYGQTDRDQSPYPPTSQQGDSPSVSTGQ